MPEPLIASAEPVGPTPVGPAGVTAAEPAQTIEEPASPANDTGELDEVDFTDLKTVPKQFQSIAKKLQSSYTKKMQALADLEGTKRSRGEEVNTPEPETDEEQQINEYMNTPQGKALYKVFDRIASEKLGDVPRTVQELRADKEIEAAEKKYGREALDENYDEIEGLAKTYPDTPLDILIGHVLYPKAKEKGAAEFRSKLQKKEDGSMPVNRPNPNIVADAPVKNINEAFELAKRQHNFN